jgi:hypothetical protein
MKKFKEFMEDVPSTSTTSVAGAGDDKIVPVHMKKKRKKKDETLPKVVSRKEVKNA